MRTLLEEIEQLKETDFSLYCTLYPLIKEKIFKLEEYILDYNFWIMEKITISELNKRWDKFGDPTNQINMLRNIMGDFNK